MTVFGDRVFMEVTNMRTLGWALIHCDCRSNRKRKLGHGHTEGRPCEDAGGRLPCELKAEVAVTCARKPGLQGTLTTS